MHRALWCPLTINISISITHWIHKFIMKIIYLAKHKDFSPLRLYAKLLINQHIQLQLIVSEGLVNYCILASTGELQLFESFITILSCANKVNSATFGQIHHPGHIVCKVGSHYIWQYIQKLHLKKLTD